ncbi:MAG: vitamin K epoxide reductase family protein [Spirulinaceae cyanobacterium]
MNTSRRRSTPWIHRWSRPIIGAIAILGATLTAYLTVIAFQGGDVACSTDAAAAAGGCNDVLSSDYAKVFGLPLPLFGLMAYISMAIFALVPLTINADVKRQLRKQIENWTWLFLLIGATSMAVFSGYLMYVLAFKLQIPCLYCISSAIFALTLFTLTVLGREWDDVGQILFTGLIAGMVTIVATLGVYANVNGSVTASAEAGPIPQVTTSPVPPDGWKITTKSGPSEIELAKHLTEVGAVKYGAFWCPHCYEQKQLFGAEAFKSIKYVECAEGGKNPQPQKCSAVGLKSFPTWEIDGEIYPGVQSLDELAEISGYKGSKDFKYTLR